MRRKRSKRPPFENRWTSGRVAWRWHQELERMGVEDARLRLTLQNGPQPVAFADPAIPPGFVRDWLAYHARRDRRATRRWRTAVLLMTVIAALGAAVGAWPIVARVLPGP